MSKDATAFKENTFVDSYKTSKFAKVFSLESFLLKEEREEEKEEGRREGKGRRRRKHVII